MKPYFAPRTRATRPRWLLEELGWAGSMGQTKDFPGLRAYTKRHYARPTAQRARAD